MAKTRQQALLELLPTAPVDDINILTLQPCEVDEYYKDRYESGKCPKSLNSITYECDSCRECFWKTEVDE